MGFADANAPSHGCHQLTAVIINPPICMGKKSRALCPWLFTVLLRMKQFTFQYKTDKIVKKEGAQA